MHRSALLPETLRFRADPGLVEAVTLAARRRRTSASSYVRAAVLARLDADGETVPPVDASAAPSSTGRKAAA